MNFSLSFSNRFHTKQVHCRAKPSQFRKLERILKDLFKTTHKNSIPNRSHCASNFFEHFFCIGELVKHQLTS